jgi:pyruvate formate lyase activating enzyme
MKVGFRKTSLVDYPGHVAAVLFFPGCNLRCPWCHNAPLVLEGQNAPDLLPLEEALAAVEKRKKLLGGVVLSGGEPTLYPALDAVITAIKNLGLPVKLDTNGLAPAVLRSLLAYADTRPDYIAMDLKIAPARYAELLPAAGKKTTIPAGDRRLIKKDIHGDSLVTLLDESAALIRAGGIEHEFRTLNLPAPYFSPSDIEALKPLAGTSPWTFRDFRPGTTIVPGWGE